MSTEAITDGMVFTEMIEGFGDLQILRAARPLSPSGKWTRRDPWIARLYGPTEWVDGCLVRNIGRLPKGYTQLYVDGVQVKAHRQVWQMAHGPIPEGLTVDHLCNTAGCILLDHLRLLTREENSSRRQGWDGGRCAKGHDITNPANVAPSGRGGRGRRCRPCWQEYMRKFKGAA